MFKSKTAKLGPKSVFFDLFWTETWCDVESKTPTTVYFTANNILKLLNCVKKAAFSK